METLIEYMKKHIGFTSMCSVTEPQLNAMSVQWANATRRQPVGELKPIGKNWADKPKDWELMFDTVKAGLPIAIAESALRKSITLEEMDLFKNSRLGFNAHLVKMDENDTWHAYQRDYYIEEDDDVWAGCSHPEIVLGRRRLKEFSNRLKTMNDNVAIKLNEPELEELIELEKRSILIYLKAEHRHRNNC